MYDPYINRVKFVMSGWVLQETNMEDEEQREDDFAKMVNANILDYLRNVHRLEVQDVSQRDAATYQLLLDFENQVISIQVSRDRKTEQRRESASSKETDS